MSINFCFHWRECPLKSREWTPFLAALFALLLSAMSICGASAQTTPSPQEFQAVLKRLTDVANQGHTAAILSNKDRAILFMNNDLVNAARTNNTIPNTVYQAAQTDFADLNRQFASEAAKRSGAKFTVQQRTSEVFSPGTDSDFITKVKSKEQILQMKQKYNDLVNAKMQKWGGLEGNARNDWSTKLDTDFMADPDLITDPREFREIAKMNNDAYKNRYAAQYEKISRQKGGGKIGPDHVTGYAEEMAEFAKKKRAKIEEILSQPHLLSDPKTRAKVITMMAQEQKYISRIESLDDFLRAQEGLPPRNRGLTAAAQGAKRSPHNIKSLKDAFAVTETSQGRALEDLAETMGEVAKHNTAFSASAADDLAKIIANAPPAHRARALAALERANPELAELVRARNPGLASADDVARAGTTLDDEARAGSSLDEAAHAGTTLDDEARAGSSLDEVARAGTTLDDEARAGSSLDEIARTGDSLGDAAKLAKARQVLQAGLKTLEALGKAAETVEVLAALAGLKDYITAMDKALDPSTPPEEVAALSKQAGDIAARLLNTTALIHILNNNPTLAAIYGGLAVTCAGGNWLAQDVNWEEIPKPSEHAKECAERHLQAHERLVDNMLGALGLYPDVAAYRQRLCDSFKRMVERKIYQPKDPFTETDICNFIKAGIPVDSAIEQGDELKQRIAAKEQEKTSGPTSGRCGPAKPAAPVPNKDGFIPVPTFPDVTDPNAECPPLGEAEGGGEGLTEEKTEEKKAEEQTEVETEQAEAGSCAEAETLYDTARRAYDSGDASAYQTGLTAAEQAMASMPAGACGDLKDRIAKGHEQADLLDKVNATAGEMLTSCMGSTLRTRAAQMRELAGLLSKTKQPYIQELVRRLDAAQQAVLTYADTKDAFADADLDTSWRRLELARGAVVRLADSDCPDLRAAVEKAPRVLSNWRSQVDLAERAISGCDVDDMERQRQRLDATSSPIAKTLSARLGQAVPGCKNEVAKDDVAKEEKAEGECKAGSTPGAKTADGKVYCVPTQATADAWCNDHNPGTGYHAVNIKSDGSHGCLPTKAKANSECRAANPGHKGIYGHINANGAVQCKQTTKAAKQEAAAAANAACQHTNRNKNARAGKYLGNGQWSCYIPGQKRTVTRRQQPGVSAADIARGAAIAGSIINQMQGRSGGGHRRGGGGCREVVDSITRSHIECD